MSVCKPSSVSVPCAASTVRADSARNDSMAAAASASSWSLMVTGTMDVGCRAIAVRSVDVSKLVHTRTHTHTLPPFPDAHRYVIDTPGVMLPLIETEEVGLKLALIGTLRDEVVGHELIADFLLFTLNRHEEFEYVRRFGLDAPSDDIHVVLAGIARRIGALLPGGHLNLELAAQHFVSKYRSGDLGRFTLDDLPPPMKRVRSS
eukprot:m.107912 g.107912  ORF g.107912 m.107912 type:complete len:204 (-) comp10638_c0_seq5:96-707(-)